MKKLLVALCAVAFALSACSSDNAPQQKSGKAKHHHCKKHASAANMNGTK